MSWPLPHWNPTFMHQTQPGWMMHSVICGEVPPFWSSELLYHFVTRKQSSSTLLLSNRKDIGSRTHCCTVTKRPSLTGSCEWMMPTGSCAAMSGLRWRQSKFAVKSQNHLGWRRSLRTLNPAVNLALPNSLMLHLKVPPTYYPPTWGRERKEIQGYLIMMGGE